MMNKNEKTSIKETIILNAIEDGWSVQKKGDFYIFRKKHENKKEILSDDYLKIFLSNTTKDNNK